MKTFTIGAATLLALAATGAQAQDVTLRLAHWLPPQHAVPQTGMQEWMDSITADSGGTITFEVDQFRKHCLLNGLDDIGLTLEKAASIDAFESRMGAERPWI